MLALGRGFGSETSVANENVPLPFLFAHFAGAPGGASLGASQPLLSKPELRLRLQPKLRFRLRFRFRLRPRL